MDYAPIKAVHVTAVTLAFGGFVLRGAGVLAGARWARSRAARTLPHVNDTVLRVSALASAWTLRANPLEPSWLAAKIVALVVYVALGTIALKSASRRRAATAWIAALITFG